MNTLPALTLTQPWASLVALGRKHIETRSWEPWPNLIAGDLAIHAAVGWSKDDREYANDLYEGGVLPVLAMDLPRGSVLCVVRLADSKNAMDMVRHISEDEREYGYYDVGRFAWLLEDLRTLREPVPVKGAQGIWRLPEDVDAAVRAQIATVRA